VYESVRVAKTGNTPPMLTRKPLLPFTMSGCCSKGQGINYLFFPHSCLSISLFAPRGLSGRCLRFVELAVRNRHLALTIVRGKHFSATPNRQDSNTASAKYPVIQVLGNSRNKFTSRLEPSQSRHSDTGNVATQMMSMNSVLVVCALIAVGSSVIDSATRLHQPVHEGAAKLPDDYYTVEDDGTKAYGLLRIPAHKPVSATGCMWRDVCSLEFSGQYEAAFSSYEALMQNCSDSDWLNVASLGRGETASVILRRTPCGTLVAAKIPVNRLGAAHNAADCAIMRRLKPALADPHCQGCFPRYYYYSNLTGICYNQYVPSIPMGRFIHSFDVAAPGTLDIVKSAFRQAIDAVAILKANGIVHRDLLFKNMLVKVHPEETPPFRVTIIDFCWAGSLHDPEAFSFTNNALGHFTRPGDWYVLLVTVKRSRLWVLEATLPMFALVLFPRWFWEWLRVPIVNRVFGSHAVVDLDRVLVVTQLSDGVSCRRINGYDDMYAIACNFADKFYKGAKGGKYRTYCLPDQDRERTDPSKLEYVIWRMTARNRPDRLGDPATLHDMLNKVVSF
jgi:hypothetical protein